MSRQWWGDSVAGVGRVLRGVQWAAPLRERLASPPADMAAWMEQHTRLLKTDIYSRVGLLDVQQQPCWLKLYLAKSPWQQAGFRLGYGRGIRSFDAAVQMARAGLPVPAPRACLLLSGAMVLLTEGIAGSRDLRALWLAQPGAGPAAQFVASAGEALAAAHVAGFAHGDCKWSNLLWNGEQCWLVDLEAVRRVGTGRRGPLCAHSRQQRDLARFTADAELLGVGPEMYGLFLDSYCGRSGCRREQVLARIRPGVEAIRERHRQRYGSEAAPLL